jgi:proton-translocating NADH-quinone oxidoreductase chain M
MILYTIFITLLISIILLFFFSYKNLDLLRSFSLGVSGFILVLSCALISIFDANNPFFQNVILLDVGSNLLNWNCFFGIDGLSVFFFFLTSLLVFICVLFIWNDLLFKEYVINLFLIQVFLFIVFFTLDLFIFYLFFEAILIPMFLVIGIWGSRDRKVRAVYLFFFYTLCGSILMLLSILYIYFSVGTLNLQYLLAWEFTKWEQLVLWTSFFISFASKIPMFPFHIWLPEAHVEAPTVGSVLLAGILLKLGVFGFLRFSLTLFPEASLFFAPLVYLCAVLGIVYASLTALRQTDMKRIVAYSSIAHMNTVVLGIFSFNVIGVQGSIFQSLSHGFVSGGMFLLIGILYSRYHTRFLYYYGGLVHTMPIFSTIFLIFTLANIALPGTSSFVGEFLLLLGVFKNNAFTAFFSALGIILCGSYSLWMYNRMVFGNIKINYTHFFADITRREFFVLLPLLFFIFLGGIYPTVFTSNFHLFSCEFLFFGRQF